MILLTGCTHTLRLGGEANNTVDVQDWSAFDDTEEYGEQEILLVEKSDINSWGEKTQNSSYYVATNNDVEIKESKSNNGQFPVIFKGMQSYSSFGSIINLEKAEMSFVKMVVNFYVSIYQRH